MSRAALQLQSHACCSHAQQQLHTLTCYAGMQVVFHCATCAPLVQNTATETLMHAVNVRGTQNVVDACVRHAVPALVYTSSSTVVFDGRDLVNVDETIPLAAKPIDFYGKTKASTHFAPPACACNSAIPSSTVVLLYACSQLSLVNAMAQQMQNFALRPTHAVQSELSEPFTPHLCLSL